MSCPCVFHVLVCFEYGVYPRKVFSRNRAPFAYFQDKRN